MGPLWLVSLCTGFVEIVAYNFSTRQAGKFGGFLSIAHKILVGIFTGPIGKYRPNK